MSHTDYLHTIQVLGGAGATNHGLVTGGEDGRVGFFDGKTRSLIDMLDCKEIMLARPSSTSSDSSSTIACGSNEVRDPVWTHGTSLHVSSLLCPINGGENWLVAGGGAETPNPTTSSTHTSRPNNHQAIVTRGGMSGEASPYSPSSVPLSGTQQPQHDTGFVAQIHLPTRTLSSARATRESINDLAFHPGDGGKIVSVGNDGVVSYWNASNVSHGRVRRADLSTPCAYAVSVNEANMLMAVGGVGNCIDCFSEYGGKSFTLDL